MKKIFALFLALTTAVSLFACGGETAETSSTSSEAPADSTVAEDTLPPASEDTEAVTEEETVEETAAETEPEIVEEPKNFAVKRYEFASLSDNVRFLGRTYYDDTGVVCDDTASGFEFAGYMKGAVRVSMTCSGTCYFSVYVDGEKLDSRFFVTKGTHEITFATFTEFGYHEIKIVKTTEPSLAQCKFNILQIACIFSELPEAKDIYIEFIGDSVMCGYGNLCDNTATNAGQPQHQDATVAFPFLTAEALDADLSVIGCSGIGLVKGAYDYCAKDFYSAYSYLRNPSASYDFARVPNIVVINLGTNDAALGANEADFKKGVKELVEFIRTTYKKDIPIVWTYNSMNDELTAPWLEAEFEAFGGESAGLYLCKLDRNGDGGNHHPSAEAHGAYAEKLSSLIKDILK